MWLAIDEAADGVAAHDESKLVAPSGGWQPGIGLVCCKGLSSAEEVSMISRRKRRRTEHDVVLRLPVPKS